MKTSPPPNLPLCGDFQTEIGITATAALDTKKRELVGDFKAVGRELEPRGKPVEVRTHDFKDKDLGHAIPYGVYDLTADEGWVSVGITSDTATFATTRSSTGGRPSANALPKRHHVDDYR
jgi:hypothetical protein